ncbi:hypothetical protein [Salmonella enterica]|uniref:hypothetical protein n=1 Tax=Salmonella enterica TaxID=28901 RepID=UPI002939FF12|nr:hypothetical protein [Salmonella enterica]MDV3228308.1 hypothetical protein [Salmonella enterica]
MQEEIRLTRARADQQEIDTMKASGEMVLVNDVAGELAKYCLQLKTAIRNIPLNVYLQLAEIADDPLAMKNLLELGTMKYEEGFTPTPTEQTTEDTTSRKRSTKATKKNKAE